MDASDIPGSQFAGLPPFPDDVPTVPLLRISLQKLIDNDTAELSRLWEACTELGFFYLDMRDAQSQDSSLRGDDFLADCDRLFEVAKEFYQLPVEEKVKYDFKAKGSYFGYKGYGDGIIDAKGSKDRNEFYNTSKDDILNISSTLPAPKIMTSYRPLFKSYIESSGLIVELLLQHLTTLLRLPKDTLTLLHRLHEPSGDQVRFVHSPPQPISDRQTALGAHTDFGSITLLSNKLGGLQVLPPWEDRDNYGASNKDGWKYVRPLPGHCIVNLGDAMVKFTAGVLRSNMHRVVNPPGEEQGKLTRLSLVYFARPEDDVILKTLKGSDMIDEAVKSQSDNAGGKLQKEEELTSKEWVLRRALGRRGVGDWKSSEGTESMSKSVPLIENKSTIVEAV